MYCIKCGVKLADTEKKCPLCETEVYYPGMVRDEATPLYPVESLPPVQVNSKVALIVWTTVTLITIFTVLWCDYQMNKQVIWSGYVVGAMLMTYAVFALPYWFRNQDPLIFGPVCFSAVGLYLLYINCATGGHWFLRFAFPVTVFLCLLVTAMATLVKRLRRGLLYIFGGGLIALGVFMPTMETLLCITFEELHFLGWSMYPLIALALLGGMLIFLGAHRGSREIMERKFFI